MIIKIYRGQPELKVTVVSDGRLVDLAEIRLVINAPHQSLWNQLSPIVIQGPWAYPPVRPYPPEPCLLPTIIYPAFEIDADGAIVFRLDNHLWSRQPGRYIGRVMVKSYEAVTIDLDLEPLTWIPSKIELNEPKVCL
jgi:hypothetical protein